MKIHKITMFNKKSLYLSINFLFIQAIELIFFWFPIDKNKITLINKYEAGNNIVPVYKD